MGENEKIRKSLATTAVIADKIVMPVISLILHVGILCIMVLGANMWKDAAAALKGMELAEGSAELCLFNMNMGLTAVVLAIILLVLFKRKK